MKDLDWLVVANGLFVLGGLLAYATPVGLPIITAVALVAALAGLWRLKEQPGRWQHSADLAASFAAGTWAVLVVLILLPYITVEDPRLWGSPAFAGLGIAAASLGMLGCNAALQWRHLANARMFMIFHAALVALAFVLVLRGDGEAVLVSVRGMEVTSLDLRLAPALAAAPGLSWAMALWQARAQD